MTAFADQLAAATVPEGSVRLWRLAQAGFVVRGAGRVVLLDPWLSDWLETPGDDNPEPVRRATPAPCTAQDLPPVELVCCTHEHPDHLDLPTLLVVAERSPQARFVVPAPIAHRLVSAGIDRERVLGVETEQPVSVAGVEVLALPAPHALDPDSLGGYRFWLDEQGRHRAVGYVLRVGGVTLFHGGDTVRAPGDAERLRREQVDVAMLPVNGRDAMREAQNLVGNLHPAEAVDLAVGAGIANLIPCHFDGIVGNTADPALVVRHVACDSLPLTVHLAGPTGVVVTR
jgi:L-ascorbate 6-phosphate lactonase